MTRLNVPGHLAPRLPVYVYVEELIRGQRVLEIDSAEGFGALFLATRASSVLGVDERETLLEAARKKCRAVNLEFRCESSEPSGLASSSFDCVVVPNGQAHLHNAGALSQWRRLLVEDGTLIVCLDAESMSLAEARAKLERDFAPVRWFARREFHGSCVYDLAVRSEDLGATLDGSLTDWQGFEPVSRQWVAVCGKRAAQFQPGLMLVEEPVSKWSAEREASVTMAAPTATGSAKRDRLVEADDDSAPSLAQGSGSFDLKVAFEKHAEQTRLLRQELEEGQAYAAELLHDISMFERQKRNVEEQVSALEAKLASADGELREWRSRASIAEGKLLRLASAEPNASSPASNEVNAQPINVLTQLGLTAAEKNSAGAPIVPLPADASTPVRMTPSISVAPPVLRTPMVTQSVMASPVTASGAATSADDRTRRISELESILRSERDARNRAESRANQLFRELETSKHSEPQAPVVPETNHAAKPLAAPSDVTTTATSAVSEGWRQAVTDARKLVDEVRSGLGVLSEKVARDTEERAPSAWAAHRDRQLRELAQDLGLKDAELAFLHVGVASLRQRLQELVVDVKDSCQSIEGGRGAANEIAAKLRERVSRFIDGSGTATQE